MLAPVPRESGLVRLWLDGLHGPLRLEDGRPLRVVFPGIPGGGAGPDVDGAILDIAGDTVRGSVELHLLASGWESHGHHRDPAYTSVALHAVGRNDSRALATLHQSGRSIPLLVLPPASAAFPPPFTPPCAFAGRAASPLPALGRMGGRRLRGKASRVGPLVASAGHGQALYTLLLEYLGGAANRAPFASIARSLPLPVLLERASLAPPGSRPAALAAELKGVAAPLALRRAGLRPMAAPARRLEAAANLIHRLWPAGPSEPPPLPYGDPRALLRLLQAPGIGRSAAIELATNAVLPVAIASGVLTDSDAAALLTSFPSPGTYGRLRRLQSWLDCGPLPSAGTLQGALLLHEEYCTRGRCGRCPLS